MVKTKLFRGRVVTGGTQGAITNRSKQSLVIDFVSAGSVVLDLEVRNDSGESHLYPFVGAVAPGTGPGRSAPAVAISQLTKILVKPGEKLLAIGGAAAEVTGHYE
jgi:hypothetical protein